jgi:threo-3-hydroxy-L-aspartate ammonia-lyase
MIECPVSIDEIRAAALALDGVAIRTPLLENPDRDALLGGRLLLMAEAAPETQVYSAEPALFDDNGRSLEAGHRFAHEQGRSSICDAIMTPTAGELTFSIDRDLLADGVTANDANVRKAMRFGYDLARIGTEPGAAVGLAAILSGQASIAGRTVATVITGGNIDIARFAALLEDEE